MADKGYTVVRELSEFRRKDTLSSHSYEWTR